MLHTVPAARRRGLGRKVVAALASRLAVAHARGERAVAPWCFVSPDNQASRRLFESLGFRDRGLVCWLRFPTPDQALV